MKNLFQTAFAILLGLGLVNAAQAQLDPQPSSPTINDLIIGFTSATATSDYELDLGQIPAGQNVQLGGLSLNCFNSIFGSPTGVNVGVVGADDGSDGFHDVITTTLRTGSSSSDLAGDEGPPAAISYPTVRQASFIPNTLTLGAVAKNDSASGFSEIIAQDPNTPGTQGASSYAGILGSNPLSTIGSSEIITLDLWEQTIQLTDPWYYQGELLIDLSGTNLSVIYNPTAAAVPEPSGYGVIAGAGLVALSLGGKLRRKRA